MRRPHRDDMVVIVYASGLSLGRDGLHRKIGGLGDEPQCQPGLGWQNARLKTV